MIYLACPYTHSDSDIVKYRIKTFCRIDGDLSSHGLITVSPLLKHLLFDNGCTLPTTWDYWKDYSVVLLSKCNRLIVIMESEWQKSTGVIAEIKMAKSLSIPITYLDPNSPTIPQLDYE